MKNLFLKRILIVIILAGLAMQVCEAQRTNNPEREIFKKSLHTKKKKVKESPSVVRAKNKQAANKKKSDEEYNAYVKQQRKHAFEIQSPDVRSRMIENRKESDARYKEKKKNRTENSRKAGKKYN
ncbi:MAG: hypothetical protein Q8868_14245 [Bacteroidota bacterium]|nr:hypothetical protein [Bacteroidota bacterium]